MEPSPAIIFYRQQGQNGCGPACLQMLGAWAGNGDEAVPAAHRLDSREGLTLRELLKLAAAYGLRGTAFSSTYEELVQAATLPCLALLNYRHYVVITKIAREGVELADPACGIRQQERSSFIAAWHQPAVEEGIWVQFR